MKKSLFVVMICALCAVFFIGCSKQASQGTGKTEIRFASWDSAETLEAQQKFVDRFNETHSDIKVLLESYGDDYDIKISAGMGSGDAPDVMYMWNYPAYYEGLENLEPYIEKEGKAYKENFYEALWPYNQMKGTIYGMPVGFTTHCLYFNKDIFDKAGLAYPSSDWTWDDLQKNAQLITEKVPGVKGFSFQLKADPYDFEMYLWSNGTSYMDNNGNTDGYLNAPKSIAVFDMFQNMEKQGWAIATEKGGSDEMSGGKTAMYVYGSWAIARFNRENLNYGIVEIPAFAGAGKDSVSILSSSGVSIAKSSKHKDAAWEFIKYWTGTKLNKERIGYELPVLKSVVAEANIMADEKTAPFYTMLEHSAGYTPSAFISPTWSDLSDELSLAFERIFNPTTLENSVSVLDEISKRK